MLPSYRKDQWGERYRTDRKKIYRPVERHLRKVLKALKKHDLNIPLSHLAWRDIHGDFAPDHLKGFRSQLYTFFKALQDYRKALWEFQKKSQELFEREMKKEGSYPAQQKEYRSLTNELPMALLEDSKIWIVSYDSYLPRIRETSSKRGSNPSNGQQMFQKLRRSLEQRIHGVEELRHNAISITKDFQVDLKKASKRNFKTWGEWREQER